MMYDCCTIFQNVIIWNDVGYLVLLDICLYKLFGLLTKCFASLMMNYFPKRPSGALLHTLSKLFDVPVGFVSRPSFEDVYCFICGRQRVAVARYRMICLVSAIPRFPAKQISNVFCPISSDTTASGLHLRICILLVQLLHYILDCILLE